MFEEKENSPAQITRRASNLLPGNLVDCFIKNNLKFDKIIFQYKTTTSKNCKEISLTTGSTGLMYCRK
jgi:hypothetical protein